MGGGQAAQGGAVVPSPSTTSSVSSPSPLHSPVSIKIKSYSINSDTTRSNGPRSDGRHQDLFRSSNTSPSAILAHPGRLQVPEVRLIRRYGRTEAGEVERDGQGRVGSLHLTPHHIIFRSTSSSSEAPPTSGETWVSPIHSLVSTTRASADETVQIPLPLLYSITRLPSSLTGATNPLLLRTRDFKTYELVFKKEDEAEAVYSTLKALCSAVGVGGVASGFAFCYQGDDSAEKKGGPARDKGKGKGWEMYDVDKEFARMGVGSRSLAWRITAVNADYTVSDYARDVLGRTLTT